MIPPDNEYVEFNGKVSRDFLAYYIVALIILIGFLTFLAVVTWQIDENTHQILNRVEHGSR